MLLHFSLSDTYLVHCLLLLWKVGAAVTGEILSEYETFTARYLYVAVEDSNIDYAFTVARIAEVEAYPRRGEQATTKKL